MKIILILILLILIIYILNRLKCIVEPYDDSVVRTNLVFTSAGDNTNFYDYWFENNRNYDVFCVYYGNNNTNYLIYSNIVDKIWNRKGSKFQNFNYIYKNFANLFNKYERFFIMDDDIIISTDNINKMFDISKEYNLWICQPSFTYESKISHHITKHNTDNILRYTNFIEVNSPLFSKYALDKFMLYYDPILVEWGVDYLYIWALGNNIQNIKEIQLECFLTKNEENLYENEGKCDKILNFFESNNFTLKHHLKEDEKWANLIFENKQFLI